MLDARDLVPRGDLDVLDDGALVLVHGDRHEKLLVKGAILIESIDRLEGLTDLNGPMTAVFKLDLLNQ